MFEYQFLVWLELNTAHDNRSAKIAKIFTEAMDIDGFSQKLSDKYIFTVTRKEEANEEILEKIREHVNYP